MFSAHRSIDGTKRTGIGPMSWILLCLALALLTVTMPPAAQAESAATLPAAEFAQQPLELRGSLDEEVGAQSAALYRSGSGGEANLVHSAQIATFTLREIAVSIILLVLGGLGTLLALSAFDSRDEGLRR